MRAFSFGGLARLPRLTHRARGSADTITVNDLTGTDVRNVNADLAGTPGGSSGDGQTDSVGRIDDHPPHPGAHGGPSGAGG